MSAAALAVCAHLCTNLPASAAPPRNQELESSPLIDALKKRTQENKQVNEARVKSATQKSAASAIAGEGARPREAIQKLQKQLNEQQAEIARLKATRAPVAGEQSQEPSKPLRLYGGYEPDSTPSENRARWEAVTAGRSLPTPSFDLPELSTWSLPELPEKIELPKPSNLQCDENGRNCKFTGPMKNTPYGAARQ